MTAFHERVRDYVGLRLPTAQIGSYEEMFLRLLEHGALARAAGNYGIAAAYVLRAGGSEVVCFGRNTVFSECDPAGHAEMNALRTARRLALARPDERADLLADPTTAVVREAPHDRSEVLLFSTLEPCPMCTVALLNARVGRVAIEHADEDAGALLRLDGLAPLWSAFARDRELHVDQLEDGSVAPELRSLLRDLFFDGKDDLDERLAREGALPERRLADWLSRRASTR